MSGQSVRGRRRRRHRSAPHHARGWAGALRQRPRPLLVRYATARTRLLPYRPPRQGPDRLLRGRPASVRMMPNKRIKRTRRAAGGLTCGRHARNLRAVRSVDHGGGPRSVASRRQLGSARRSTTSRGRWPPSSASVASTSSPRPAACRYGAGRVRLEVSTREATELRHRPDAPNGFCSDLEPQPARVMSRT